MNGYSKTESDAKYLTFPVDKLINPWNSTTTKCFRIMLDAVNGNDNNDGYSWAKSKKTLSGVSSILPNNLNGFLAIVLIQSGTYQGAPFIINNGTVQFVWVGSYLNNANTAYSNWVCAGSTNPIRDMGQVIITAKGDWSDSMLLESKDGSGSFRFDQQDLSKGVYDANACYYDRIKFMPAQDYAGDAPLLHTANCTIKFDSGATFELGNCPVRGVAFWGGTKGWFQNLKIIGGNGNASVSTSIGRAAILIEGDTNEFELRSGGIAYHPSYAPLSNKGWQVSGIRNLIALLSPGKGLNITIGSNITYSQGSLPDANLPYIRTSTNGSGYTISFNPDYIQLSDNGTGARIINDLKTGTIKNYLSSNINDNGTNLIIKTGNTTPADADLSNSDIIFYKDESSGKLKVKLKYADGTVKTGEIILN